MLSKKEKHRLYMQKWRLKNPEKAALLVAKWRKNNPTRAKAFRKEEKKKSTLTHPNEKKARRLAWYHIKMGWIKRGLCQYANQNCGGRVEAHHNSYKEEEWLALTWLCKKHHVAWHKVFIAERRAT